MNGNSNNQWPCMIQITYRMDESRISSGNSRLVQLLRVCISFPCLLATRNVTLENETLAKRIFGPTAAFIVGIDLYECALGRN